MKAKETLTCLKLGVCKRSTCLNFNRSAEVDTAAVAFSNFCPNATLVALAASSNFFAVALELVVRGTGRPDRSTLSITAFTTSPLVGANKALEPPARR